MTAGRYLGLASALILAAAACRSTAPLDVSVSLPAATPFAPGALSTVIVTALRDEAPLPDFSPAPALEEALASALRRGLKDTGGEVEQAAVDGVAGRDDATVWQAAGAGKPPGTVFLAGTVRLSGQTLKAVDPKAIVDGPFDLARRLIAKRRWTFALDLFVISASTGETLYHETLRESQDYGELDKSAEFAFSELSERVLDRLRRSLLGRPTVEIRTLLRR